MGVLNNLLAQRSDQIDAAKWRNAEEQAKAKLSYEKGITDAEAQRSADIQNALIMKAYRDNLNKAAQTGIYNNPTQDYYPQQPQNRPSTTSGMDSDYIRRLNAEQARNGSINNGFQDLSTADINGLAKYYRK